jgi:hypothetical protein
MSWVNGDGLYVKFGREEAANVRGREGPFFDNGNHVVEFIIDYRDVLSATDSILGSVTNTTDLTGSFGIVVPKGARISALEIMSETAWTSSGTIGSSTLLVGLIKASDRTTELDFNGFSTASFVGSRLDGVGERTYIEIGSTGAGALIGTTLSEAGVISVSNSAHASHPYTAGVARCRLYYRCIA